MQDLLLGFPSVAHRREWQKEDQKADNNSLVSCVAEIS